MRLFGGHRNDVFKTNGFVKVVWRNGFKRRGQIREAVLLENFVATHTDMKARMLVDKSKPVQEEDGKLVTYFHYVDGEIRYPWTLDEIASAARLLSKLHRIKHCLHLDYARGNVLFAPKTHNAIGVIDFETTGVGPVEQELGRTLSFLLVDTPTTPGSSSSGFAKRSEAFLTNYGLPYKKNKVLFWAKEYLNLEDYGDLNSMRDNAIEFLIHSFPAS